MMVAMRIEHDLSRFKQIVRGKIRQNLRKYITHGEMIGHKGSDLVSIPVAADRRAAVPLRQEGLRRRRPGRRRRGHARSARRRGRRRRRARPAATPGGHILEVEVSLEELAAILGEELRTAAHRAEGQEEHRQKKDRYTSIRRAGPESLRHFKRTYKEALRRQISSNSYVPERSAHRADSRGQAVSRLERSRPSREANAVVIYMMDVSGSMTDEQKEIVRIEAFWIDTWMHSQYQGVETPLHHSRRGRQGSGRAHLLSHARKRRHEDQLGLRGVRRPDRARVSGQRLEHLLLPVLRRRQLGRRQRAQPASCCATSCCRKSTCSATARSKAPTAAASTSARWNTASATTTTSLIAGRDREQEAIYESIKEFLGNGSISRDSTAQPEARCIAFNAPITDHHGHC